MPKTTYENFIKDASKITLAFVIRNDNRICSVRWNAYSGSSIIRYFDIPLPNICYFNGIKDGNTGDENRHVTLMAYNDSDQYIHINYLAIGGDESGFTPTVEADIIGPILEYESDYQTNVYNAGPVPGYRLLFPLTMIYYTVEVDYTGLSYENLPVVPVTVFE